MLGNKSNHMHLFVANVSSYSIRYLISGASFKGLDHSQSDDTPHVNRGRKKVSERLIDLTNFHSAYKLKIQAQDLRP